jgi:short-subunit dehydrogenase
MQTTAEKIVVTGASSGIGRELAIQLASSGTEIWLVGRDSDRLEQVAEIVRGKGSRAHVLRLDLRDFAAASKILEETFPEGSRVDQVYLAAAVTMFGEVKDVLAEDWECIYQTDLLSPVQWLLYFYGKMAAARRGRIVIISSLAAYSGYPYATAYATMKAGLLGLYRSLAHESGHYGVSIHLASPGYVDTDIYRKAIFRGTTYRKTMSQIESLGFRVLSPDEAARCILRGIRRGKTEFAVPGYASALKWIAPRMPVVIALVHSRIVNHFRNTP